MNFSRTDGRDGTQDDSWARWGYLKNKNQDRALKWQINDVILWSLLRIDYLKRNKIEMRFRN